MFEIIKVQSGYFKEVFYKYLKDIAQMTKSGIISNSIAFDLLVYFLYSLKKISEAEKHKYLSFEPEYKENLYGEIITGFINYIK